MNDTNELEGAAAFSAVIAHWRDGSVPLHQLREPAFRRLSAALRDARASAIDKLVLLRQVLRYESLRTGRNATAVLRQPLDPIAAQLGLSTVGNGNDRFEVTAVPWVPAWIENGVYAVDGTAMEAPMRRFGPALGPSADPFLRALGHDRYRSPTQQAAIRAVVSMPAGASLIVDLPTGEGKSTVFRVVGRTGFASDLAGQAVGLVVVVVPTVTLALDHERTCGGSDVTPLAYVGSREGRNAMIRDGVRSGNQQLVFAAPEAVVSSLREPITRAAKDGRLGAVVVDEAHLIDGWGTGFRTEFQTLSGVMNAWREIAPGGRVFRTIFLSATLADGAIQAIRDLFSPEVPIPIASGAQVRPEPEYWVAEKADTTTRRIRVEEALMHLPRPAILYFTRVRDVDWWGDRLRHLGYRRFALVHGGTEASERERVLKEWSEGGIDLVIATSAFGLGIDYAHVRSIIHACMPETFDRFYQEVGRAGRDGRASISALIPDLNDRQVARSLSAKKVITVERGLERWTAMFKHPAVKREGHPRYVVPLDIAPGFDSDDIDLIGERSTDWNQRTLALMARSGLIRLLGACVGDLENPDHPHQFERIDILDDNHLDATTWHRRVGPTRRAIFDQGARAFAMVDQYVSGSACPARLVGSLYGAADRQVALVCSGCSLCRADPLQRVPDGFVAYKPSPWPLQGPLAPMLDRLWSTPRVALVTYPTDPPPSRAVRDFGEALQRLDSYGMRVWIEVGGAPPWMKEQFDRVMSGRPWVAVSSDTWDSVRWPKGARLIVCGHTHAPTADLLYAGVIEAPRIVFVADRAPDPTQPSRELASIAYGPVYSLQSFVSAVLQ